ncbi:MAG: preprotein translocase subunit SecG [Candidatus Borkfalkiaceae bacterium]|nr:preprotein translocase subunit SecG [Christensenellaceae bacterium]
MEAILANLLFNYDVYMILSRVCVILSVLCAGFVTIVVMIQSGNSNGVSALGGSSDTFYGKNKSKTVESKLRRLTVICIAIMTVLLIAYYIIERFYK